MAMDESASEEIGFLSDRDLEDIFEGDNVFSSELESQTIARLDWLTTRQRAIFVLVMTELNIDPVTAAKLSYIQHMFSDRFSDFVSTGIGAEHDTPPIKHPLDDVINELVDGITEPHGFENAAGELGPVGHIATELLGLSDEQLLHRLGNIPARE
jgi:hypothetical protein